MASSSQISFAASRANGYTRLQIGLHWAVVALVVLQLAVNDGIRLAFRGRLEGVEAASPGAWVHVVFGLAVLAIMLLRLAIRLKRGSPAPAEGVPPVLHAIASVTHWALYATLIAMPLTGAIAWFGAVEAAAVAHEALRLALIGLIAAHAMGALFEHFAMGNETLMRMITLRRKRAVAPKP